MNKHRVAITGVNGYVGSVLRDYLLKQDDVEFVLGLDIKNKSVKNDKFKFIKTDVRSNKIEEILKENQITDLFHLAFILENISDENLMYDINVNGTENILNCATAAGLKSVTVASSISVFGAWENAKSMHPENDNPRPNEGDLYGLHKTIVEGICEKYMATYPEMKVMIVRFSGVFGPNLNSKILLSALKQPVVVLPYGSEGAFQIIHEEEVAEICYRAMKNGTSGIYHAAGRDVITMKELYQILGKKYFYMPYKIIRTLALFATKIKLAVTNTFQLELLRYPVLIDGEQTFKKLGTRPLKSAMEIISEFAYSHGLKVKKPKK